MGLGEGTLSFNFYVAFSKNTCVRLVSGAIALALCITGIDSYITPAYNATPDFARNSGAIAQLGERLHGMQEVGGSIPPSSTKLLYTRQNLFCITTVHLQSPSSRGLGHRPFTAVTGVRIPLGTPFNVTARKYTRPYKTAVIPSVARNLHRAFEENKGLSIRTFSALYRPCVAFKI